MPKTTVNISLPDTMKSEIEKIVSMDGYGNTSEFFRDLVRGYLKKRKELKLESMLIETVENGDFSPVTSQDFADIKKRGLDRVRQLKQK